jgi:hypothetical protein
MAEPCDWLTLGVWLFIAICAVVVVLLQTRDLKQAKRAAQRWE